MPANSLRPRPLGTSGMTVSAMSLGSWRTFERLPPEAGAAILAAARDEGINFLDDARYDDETGRAPLPTGYSEVLFGELFRSAGVRRLLGELPDHLAPGAQRVLQFLVAGGPPRQRGPGRAERAAGQRAH